MNLLDMIVLLIGQKQIVVEVSNIPQLSESMDNGQFA